MNTSVLPQRHHDAVLHFLFPETCVLCGAQSRHGYPVCDDCIEHKYLAPIANLCFNAIEHSRCRKCGRPLISCNEVCTVCRNTDSLTAIDRILPLYSYSAENRELLAAWKTRGRRNLSGLFAYYMLTVLSNIICKGFSVVPVPPRPGKLRERGWDQIEDIARILEKKYRIPIARCLYRTAARQQKKLNRVSRLLNLKGQILIKRHRPVPEKAIVIDDLMTTGSTLEACATALKTAGCRVVYGLTLFYD